MSTYDEIVSDAKAQRNTIIDKEKEINRELALTSDANDTTRLTATENAYIDTREMLDLVTLQALDNAADLANLKSEIAKVTKALNDTKNQIAKWGTIASGVTTALTGLNNLAGKLGALTG